MPESFVFTAELLRKTVSSSMDLRNGLTLSDRREAIRLRRLMWTLISDLETSVRNMKGAELRQQCLVQIGLVRSATALHHASWPITLIELGDEDYEKSIAAMIKSYDLFLLWVRQQKEIVA